MRRSNVLLYRDLYKEIEMKSSKNPTLANNDPSQFSLRMANLTNTIRHKRSLLDRASYSSIKIALLGLLLCGGVIALGVLYHFLLVVIVASVCAAFIVFLGALLRNHYSSNQRPQEEMLKMVENFGQVVDDTILKLQEQLAQTTAINEKLQASCKTFEEQVGSLTLENKKLAEENDRLSLIEQKLADTQAKLAETTAQHQQVVEKLKTEVSDLGTMKDKLTEENKKMEAALTLLQSMIASMTDHLAKDTDQKASFLENLQQFLKDGSTAFDTAVLNLRAVQTKLEKTEKKYTALLAEYQQTTAKLNDVSKRLDTQYLPNQSIFRAPSPASPTLPPNQSLPLS